MSPPCPQCLSPNTKPRHLGKRIGTIIGALVGAVGGAVSAGGGIHIRKPSILVIPPRGLPGAIVGAIAGGVAGSATGAAIGEAIDGELIDSHLCLSCGNTFNPTHFESAMWDNR